MAINFSPPPNSDMIADGSGRPMISWQNWFSKLTDLVGDASSALSVFLTTDGTPGTPAYATQYGRYTRCGNIAMVEFDLKLTSWAGSPTGNVLVGGFSLPFAADASGAAISLYSGVMLNASHTQLSLFGVKGTKLANLYSSGSGTLTTATKIPVGNLSTTARIAGNIIYSI